MSERIRSVDANLLLALHALLEERNLTHAGIRMTMSQPAMSGALTRLRRHFGDELLVRHGREFELTPLAERLRPLVAAAVAASERLLGSDRAFRPSTVARVFSVSLTDYAMTVLAEPLSRALAAEAPHVSVAFDMIPTKRDVLERHLLRRDLLVGPLGFDLPGRSQPLFSDRIVCIVAEMKMGGIGLGGAMITASRFADSPGVFAGIVEIAMVGYVLVKAMTLVRRRLLIWHQEALVPSTV